MGAYQAQKLDNREESYSNQIGLIQQTFQEISDLHGFKDTTGNQIEKQKKFKADAIAKLGEDFGGKKINQTMKASLTLTGFNPGHFGFGQGGQDSSAVNSFVRQQAQSDWDLLNQEMLKSKAENLEQGLEKYNAFPQVHEFQGSAIQDEKTLFQGYALQGFMEMKDRLWALALHLKSLGQKKGMPDWLQAVQFHLSKMDAQTNDKAIQTWIEQAVEIEWQVKFSLEESKNKIDPQVDLDDLDEENPWKMKMEEQ